MLKNTTLPSLCQSSEYLPVSSPLADHIGSLTSAVTLRPGCRETPGGPKPISCPPQIANFGIDTLHVTFDTECTNGSIWIRLKEAKEQLQATGEKDSAFKFLENGSECMTWNLQRVGSKFYQYVLTTGDIRLGLSPRKQGSSIPNMELKIGSMSCQQGLTETLKTLKFWLEIIGIRIVEEKVSRCDIAADILHDIRTGEIDQIDVAGAAGDAFAQHFAALVYQPEKIAFGDFLFRR